MSIFNIEEFRIIIVFVFVCTLILFDIIIWSCVPLILRKEDNVQPMRIQPPSPPSLTGTQETIDMVLQLPVLIPLIIASVFVLILIIILFTYCNKERADAVTDVIRSVRGKPPENKEKENSKPQVLYIDTDDREKRKRKSKNKKRYDVEKDDNYEDDDYYDDDDDYYEDDDYDDDEYLD